MEENDKKHYKHHADELGEIRCPKCKCKSGNTITTEDIDKETNETDEYDFECVYCGYEFLAYAEAEWAFTVYVK